MLTAKRRDTDPTQLRLVWVAALDYDVRIETALHGDGLQRLRDIADMWEAMVAAGVWRDEEDSE